MIAETSTTQINEAEKRRFQNQIPTVELFMLATLSRLLALANTCHSFPREGYGNFPISLFCSNYGYDFIF